MSVNIKDETRIGAVVAQLLELLHKMPVFVKCDTKMSFLMKFLLFFLLIAE